MNQSQMIERSARLYLQGKIQIHHVVLLEKQPGQAPDSYHTSEAAFLFPVSGRCEISFDEVSFNASYGTVIHGCPHRQICFRVIGDEPFRCINLYYATQEELLYELHPAAYGQILERVTRWLTYQQDPGKNASMIQGLRKQIFAALFHPYVLSEARSEIDLVNEVEAYLQEHYMMDLSLDFLSGIFGKTRNQMSYLFYKHKNIRPIEYLISYRLSVASQMLTTTDLSISEISHSVGYRDSLFFSRLFKKHYGCSPRAFRALYK